MHSFSESDGIHFSSLTEGKEEKGFKRVVKDGQESGILNELSFCSKRNLSDKKLG